MRQQVEGVPAPMLYLNVMDDQAEKGDRPSLFASFLRGMASISIFGQMGPSTTSYDAPYLVVPDSDEALRSDWERIQGDLRRAIERTYPLKIRQQVEPELYGEPEEDA
ncbi:MAG: hypothetical protein GY856_36735 [bacterium]|nr:hypothetical protein [bacterium]